MRKSRSNSSLPVWGGGGSENSLEEILVQSAKALSERMKVKIRMSVFMAGEFGEAGGESPIRKFKCRIEGSPRLSHRSNNKRLRGNAAPKWAKSLP